MTSLRGLKRQMSTHEGSVSPPPVKRKVESTTTKSAVASFFTPASKKVPEKISWRVVNETLLVARYGSPNPSSSQARQRVVGLDFDSTLISPASGKKFGRDALDWKWWHSSVPGTIKSLARDGHLIVVMSNQGGISLNGGSKTLKMDQKRLSDFKGKVAAVLAQLDIPITVYAATGRDQYRKPRTGMWQQLIKDYEVEPADSVDLENSVFVGDAAGRLGSMNNGAAKDHSCSDRDFASNVGIDFKTPEEFFLGEQPKPFVRLFDPAKYLVEATTMLTDAASLRFARLNPLDLVLFCGSPGAGKSTLYWQHLKPLGYERVNQDVLKTRDRCMKNAVELISNGSPVVVDNTNADPDTRSQWINLAKRLDVPIRCILFTADPRLCEHNDTVRALNVTLMNPEKRTLLPKIAFAGFLSRYREPSLQEGFQDITKVDFKFEGSEEQQKVWRKFWI
ncbi:polynucleotide kinase 3 phosphatase-domain-containing protein [Cryomyces antarcticus]